MLLGGVVGELQPYMVHTSLSAAGLIWMKVPLELQVMLPLQPLVMSQSTKPTSLKKKSTGVYHYYYYFSFAGEVGGNKWHLKSIYFFMV